MWRRDAAAGGLDPRCDKEGEAKKKKKKKKKAPRAAARTVEADDTAASRKARLPDIDKLGICFWMFSVGERVDGGATQGNVGINK
jgi:hypothetical protein